MSSEIRKNHDMGRFSDFLQKFSKFSSSALFKSLPIFWTAQTKKVFPPCLWQIISKLGPSKILHNQATEMLHQQKRKYLCPACGKACSSLSTVVGFLSQSWQCGSLPATWWSGAETRRTVPRNLWGVGWMGTTRISDLKICRNEMQINT